MNAELKNTYITAIANSVNIIFDEFLGVSEYNIALSSEGKNLAILSIEGDQVRVVSDNDSDDEGYLLEISKLPDEIIILLNQILNYNIIKGTSSIILPKINDQNEIEETGREYSFILYAIDFNMTFEEYQQSDDTDMHIGDEIEVYNEYNEALVQQRNMLN